MDETKVFNDRMAWWANSDHVLDVGGISPQETVKGAGGWPLPSADPEHRSISAAALERAVGYVKPFHTQSLLVWQGGEIQFEWYGEGFDQQSRSSPASMMKPVMALAVGAAIDKGLIHSVDDPVSTYLREWTGQPRGAITLRQLLQMATGLRKDASTSDGGRGAQLMLGTRLEETLLETELVGKPGTEFDYNNTNSGLMGLVLERATQMRYAEWLSQSLWKPIGASDAAVWLDRPGGLARAYCCLLTTGRDWLRTGLLIKDHGRFNGHQVVSSRYIDQMLAPSPHNPNFGFQIWRASPYVPLRGYGAGSAPPIPAAEPFLAEDIVYFDGALGQRVYISRSRDLVIVRVGTSTDKWDDSVLPNIIVEGMRAVG